MIILREDAINDIEKLLKDKLNSEIQSLNTNRPEIILDEIDNTAYCYEIYEESPANLSSKDVYISFSFGDKDEISDEEVAGNRFTKEMYMTISVNFVDSGRDYTREDFFRMLRYQHVLEDLIMKNSTSFDVTMMRVASTTPQIREVDNYILHTAEIVVKIIYG